MFKALAVGTTALALFIPVTATASAETETEAAQPPGKVTVEVVTVNGSGCAPGTAAVAPSPDNTAFTVTYSDYLAQAGGGAGATEFRKNCQLNVNVHTPQGFTYAISRVDYRGFASLQKGASALLRSSFYFQGSAATAHKDNAINGPLEDNWQRYEQVATASLVWKRCGETRNVNLNTELRVYAGSSKKTSFVAMDSTDGSVKTVYHLAWKKC